jgi:hypothetical protein
VLHRQVESAREADTHCAEQHAPGCGVDQLQDRTIRDGRISVELAEDLLAEVPVELMRQVMLELQRADLIGNVIGAVNLQFAEVGVGVVHHFKEVAVIFLAGIRGWGEQRFGAVVAWG